MFDLGIVIPPKHVGAHYGRVAFIEVKTARGRLSEYQQEFQDGLIHNRIPHCVARSIDDVREALKIWGVSTNEASLREKLQDDLKGAVEHLRGLEAFHEAKVEP